jgi:hypothetical protein
VDQSVLLSPDGVITQSSTTAPFIEYTSNSAYVTTYSWAAGGSGYLYKISPVFGGGTPAIVWSTPITGYNGGNVVPSGPVYDSASGNVFLTDSDGDIDVVDDTPAETAHGPFTYVTTTLEPPVVDTVNQLVYVVFNNNSTNAVVLQTNTSVSSSLSVPIGTENTTFTGPYGVDFNNAYYTNGPVTNPGISTPLLFVVGTGTGTVPTLYSIGFDTYGGSGEVNIDTTDTPASAPLTSGGIADASPVTEFFNDPDGIPADGTEYLFAGVTNDCVATTLGGSAGCVMSLNINSGAPTVNADTTALPAAGGTTGIVVDNDSTDSQASSLYYATQTGATLVKATQSGLQ